MISKELLSEVLGEHVFIICSHVTENGVLSFYKTPDHQGNGDNDYINIYELAHKCKEWLHNKGFMTTIFFHLDTVAVNISFNTNDIYWTPSMTVYTEPEAIFKACQWILDNKDNK